MAAYLIANIEIRDQEAFATYGERVRPVVESYGGRYLVRGGALQSLEGDLKAERLVVIEFPSLEVARAFYGSADYAPLLRLRLDSTASDVVLVDGWSPPG